MESSIADFVAFVREHRGWAPPLVFLLAFAESIAFLSLLIPGWGLLVAMGGLIGAGSLEFVPLWLAGALGAAAGDWLSYEIAVRYKERVRTIWPLSKYPWMLARGEAFFRRFGGPGVALARFSGPLRASVPLAAGICDMPRARFQVANVLSAFLWAAVLLAPGAVAGGPALDWLRRVLG